MSFLKQLQSDIVGRLKSCPDFDCVDVVDMDGTGAKKVDVMRDRLKKVLGGLRKTKGKSGLAVLVLMPVVRVEKQARDLPGPQLSIQCGIQVLENIEWNRGNKGTGIYSENLAFTVLALLHHFQPSPSALLFADETSIEPVETDDEMPADQAYQVNVTTPLGVTPFNKCPSPSIIIHEGVATVFGPTGSRVYYVLGEDTFPWSGNECAKLYSEPFAVTPGQIIRAAAYADNAVGSDIFQTQAP